MISALKPLLIFLNFELVSHDSFQVFFIKQTSKHLYFFVRFTT